MSRAMLSLAWFANCSFFASLVCVCVRVCVCVSVCVCMYGSFSHSNMFVGLGGKLRISSIRYQVVPVSSTIGIL